MYRLLLVLLVLPGFLACDSASGPDNPSDRSTPFSFTKPSLGTTFTMQFIIDSAGRVISDTTLIYEVIDDNASHAGRSGLVEMMNGYSIQPFYVSYHGDGDLDIWGYPDLAYGRDAWVSYPFTLNAGAKRSTYFHDSLITVTTVNGPPDTREVKADTFSVLGRESLQVKGQDVECIKGRLSSTYKLTDLKFGFTTGSVFVVTYWYAPSLGFWVRSEFTLGPFTWRYIMTDHTP